MVLNEIISKNKIRFISLFTANIYRTGKQKFQKIHFIISAYLTKIILMESASIAPLIGTFHFYCVNVGIPLPTHYDGPFNG